MHMKLLKSFCISLGTKILVLFILLISRTLTARMLGPENLGSVGNALNLTTIISRWGSLGIAPATQFTGSKYPDQRNVLLIYVIAISLFLGLLNFLILIYFKDEIFVWHFNFDRYDQNLFLRFIPWLPVVIMSMTIPVLLLGLGQFKDYSFTQILPPLLQTTLICLAYNRLDSIDLIVFSQLISWISAVVIALFLFDYTNFSFQIERQLFLIYTKYALQAWPQVILQFGIARFAILIGNHYLSSQDLGFYILAANLSDSFLILTASVTPVLFNQIALKGADLAFLGRSIRFSNLFSLLIFTFVALLGKPVFLYFFGIIFAPSWNLLLLLLLSVVFNGMIRICINYLAALEKNIAVSLIQGIQLCTLLVASSFTCPAFGLSGLCYASILASISGFLFCLMILKQLKERKELSIISLFLINREDTKIIYAAVKQIRKS